MKPKWIVHKFGGTSVANAECYRRVANILISKNTNDVNTAVVVSAMSKTTDSLIELVKTAVKRDSAYEAGLRALKKRHLDTVDHLELSEDLRSQLSTTIESDCADLADLLRGVWLARSYS
jgi:aspartokinase